jgi:hypothetical protein
MRMVVRTDWLLPVVLLLLLLLLLRRSVTVV